MACEGAPSTTCSVDLNKVVGGRPAPAITVSGDQVGTGALVSEQTVNVFGTLRPWSGTSDLFIRPPFEFRAIDALLTNFHFPRTTLLILVQTFGGWELIAEAYRQAIREEYRFYSYGDAMLIV